MESWRKGEGKGKVVSGNMLGWVICEEHSSPWSLHCTEREVNAARLPASRSTLHSNAALARPSGRTITATPCLEWAGSPHAFAGPALAPHIHAFLPPLGWQAVATPPRYQSMSAFSPIYTTCTTLPILMGFFSQRSMIEWILDGKWAMGWTDWPWPLWVHVNCVSPILPCFYFSS